MPENVQLGAGGISPESWSACHADSWPKAVMFSYGKADYAR